MSSKIEPTILEGLNYVVWVTDMKTLLKSKDLWQYRKVAVLDPSNDLDKFFIDRNKDENVGVIITYISQVIQFHANGIDCPHEV